MVDLSGGDAARPSDEVRGEAASGEPIGSARTRGLAELAVHQRLLA